jgi:hypothetical protein
VVCPPIVTTSTHYPRSVPRLRCWPRAESHLPTKFSSCPSPEFGCTKKDALTSTMRNAIRKWWQTSDGQQHERCFGPVAAGWRGAKFEFGPNLPMRSAYRCSCATASARGMRRGAWSSVERSTRRRAAVTTETITAGSRPVEVTRVRITKPGERRSKGDASRGRHRAPVVRRALDAGLAYLQDLQWRDLFFMAHTHVVRHHGFQADSATAAPSSQMERCEKIPAQNFEQRGLQKPTQEQEYGLKRSAARRLLH